MVGGSLGCSHHEMVEFRILGGGSRTISKTKTMDFSRANSGLFKVLLGRIPWVRALEGSKFQESWLIFKHPFLQAQNQYIPMKKKSIKESKRPA